VLSYTLAKQAKVIGGPVIAAPKFGNDIWPVVPKQ
jgi:hypothetical protein